jgi:hypothetical protein
MGGVNFNEFVGLEVLLSEVLEGFSKVCLKVCMF